MRTVHKFRVTLDDNDSVTTPIGRITAARMSYSAEAIEFWVEVDTDGDIQQQVSVVGTGHPMPNGFSVAATVFDGRFVWHLTTDGPL